MKILQCDCCHVKVNNYAHWFDDAKPRNMYELKSIHTIDYNNYDEMILCHECLSKLMHNIKGTV